MRNFILPDLTQYTYIALDIETYDPYIKTYGSSVRHGGFICGISVATETKDAWYIPFNHEQGFNFEEEKVKKWALDNLCIPHQPKIGANLIYDLDYLHFWGVPVCGKFFDIQIAEPLIDETQLSFSLETLSQKYLNIGKYEIELEEYCEAHLGKKQNPKSNIYRMPSEIVAKYAIMDALNALEIFEHQKVVLEKEGLTNIFLLESELLELTLEMRKKGVRVDIEKTEQLITQFEIELKQKKLALNSMAGYDVNVNAARSIQCFCDANKIKYMRTPKSGEPSFTKSFLRLEQNPFFKKILEIRELEKFTNTFLKQAILKYNIKERIHCQFNQLRSDKFGTVSGRYSSSNPNLQQIPARSEKGKIIRSLFIPDEGERWVKADYSQIEPRVTLHYAWGQEAQKMRDMFFDNPSCDAYAPMMNMLPNISRATIKQLYLGLCYGMGQAALCKNLNMTEREGKELIRQFNIILPYLDNLNRRAKEKARRNGCIMTILGRRRQFKYPFFYKALNALIQGSSADILKKAMLDVYRYDRTLIPLLTVHDELDFSIPHSRVDFKREIKDIMENCVKTLRVPLHLDVEEGNSWGEVK